MTNGGRRRLLGLALLGAMGLAGCGSHAPAGPTDPDGSGPPVGGQQARHGAVGPPARHARTGPTPGSTIDSGVQPLGPVTAGADGLSASAVDLATHSGGWPATEAILENAVNRLNRKCLARHGFAYPELPAVSFPDAEDDAAAIGMFRRRSVGYGIAASGTENVDQPSVSDPVDGFYGALSPAERERFSTVLFGPPGSEIKVDTGGGGYVAVKGRGCEAESRSALAGDVGTWAQLSYIPERLDNVLARQVPSDPRYRRAIASWRSCMVARGYRYATPEAARDALSERYRRTGGTEAFRRDEISVAVADGQCAILARVPRTAVLARRDRVRSLPAPELATLVRLAALRDAAVGRARRLLSP